MNARISSDMSNSFSHSSLYKVTGKRRRRERKVGALRDRLLKSGIDIKHRRAARLRPQ
jgi:hypothetical protein